MRAQIISYLWAALLLCNLNACSPTDGVTAKPITTGGDEIKVTTGTTGSTGSGLPSTAPRCALIANGTTNPLSLAVGDVVRYSTDGNWDPLVYRVAWFGSKNGTMDMVDVENTVTAYNGPLFVEAAGNAYTRWLIVTNRATQQIVCDSRSSGGIQRGPLMVGVRNLELASKAIGDVNGRSYYLLDPSFECNRSNGERIKTYREAIAFATGTGVTRRAGCADSSTTAEFTGAYQFTSDLKFLQVAGLNYTYSATEPTPIRVAKLQKAGEKGPRERKPASQK